MSRLPDIDIDKASDKTRAILAALSMDRLSSYLKATDGDLTKGLELYTWNTQVSGALYGPLQGFEVILRNAMNRELVKKHGEDWHTNTKPVLFREEQNERIKKIKERWTKSRKITLPDIVADLSFGFWSDILEHKMYEDLWNRALNKSFPNRPKGTRRPDAAAPVVRLYRLRNRIAHHEPIWQMKLKEEHDSIVKIAYWICPETSEWIQEQSSFPEVFQSKPTWLDTKR